MHRSRLASIIIDCETGTLDEAADFWSHALGRSIVTDQVSERYAPLEDVEGEPIIEVQRVERNGGVHIDIETDDLEAEVRRLESLGATRVGFIKRWWVLEAPTGQRFCVVPPQRPGFPADTNVWPGGDEPDE